MTTLKRLLKETEKYKAELQKQLSLAQFGKRVNKKYTTTWLSDASDHIALCNKILDKHPSPRQLHNWLWDLDTDSRDQFPETIWNYCYE